MCPCTHVNEHEGAPRTKRWTVRCFLLLLFCLGRVRRLLLKCKLNVQVCERGPWPSQQLWATVEAAALVKGFYRTARPTSMSEFCFLSRWLLFWANLINKELDLGSFHFLISSKFWSHWFLKGTVGEREKLFSQPRVWEQKLTLNSSSNEQSWMLAYEGRGNRVFWGHPGLCCGKVEKV